jgi:hypothetical protein
MKRPGPLTSLGRHKRVRPASNSSSHFEGMSRISLIELKDTIASCVNDPPGASRLFKRVLIERVIDIYYHDDPPTFVFACETVSRSSFSEDVIRFEVEVIGNLAQDVEALRTQMLHLGTPQPLKLLLRGGIYAPYSTEDSEIAFCLSFKEGIAFKFSALEEMSFGTERRLI